MRMIRNIKTKYDSLHIAAKASLWFMLCTILQKSVALLTTPIFTRLMSTEQYGQFSVYNSWLSIFTIFTTLRLNWAVFNKGMSKFKDDRDGYTSTMQTVTFILTAICFGIYMLFRVQFEKLTELPTYIMVFMFLELALSPAIDFWTIRKRYEYIYIPVFVRTLIMTLANAIFGVIAVLLVDEKGYARIMTIILVDVCFGSVLFVHNLKKGKKLLCLEYAKYALGFNLPLLLHYLSQYVLDQFDKIMIQKMVGVSAAGLYGVAYSAGMLMKIVTTNLNTAIVPWQYDQLEKKQLKQQDDIIFVVLILVGAVSIMFTAFAPEIMHILADEKYYEAVYAIPPISLGMFYLFCYTVFVNVEMYYNLTGFAMFISMAGAVLNVLMNYLGISKFGYLAAAYTTLICYILFAFGHYIYMTHQVKKALSVNQVFETKRILILWGVILTIGILVIGTYRYPLIRYGFVLFLGFMVYQKREIVKQTMGVFKKK